MKQKEEHLQQIIDTLETDIKGGLPMSAIRVDDISTGSVFNILCNSTNDDLVKEYGSASNFFESLSKSNVKKIRIIPLKRNGTQHGNVTWKKATKILPLEMGFELNEMPGETKHIEPEKKQPHNFEKQDLGLNGGLNEASFRFFDHTRLQGENSDLKAENALLVKENNRLEKEILKNEYLGQRSIEKSEGTAKIIEAGKGYLPEIITALKMLKTEPLVQGLSGAISPIKERFLKADDELLFDLEQVGMRFDIQDFADELKLLVNKYPIQNGG